MSLMLLLAITLFVTPTVPPPAALPIQVVAIKASSTLPDWKGYTFHASNLIDGRVDTSWQPAKNDTLGVGQWVELDLGRPHAIASIEVSLGLQKVDPELGDLYCRNNRFAEALFIYEDGSRTPLYVHDFGEREVRNSRFIRPGEPGKEFIQDASTVTRRVRMVVNSVQEPVDWNDLAVAEIRIFGTPAELPATSVPYEACDGVGAWPFRTALVDYCATSRENRHKRDCWNILRAFISCRMEVTSEAPMPGYDTDQIARGRVVQTFTDRGEQHRVEFVRAPDGAWSVMRHSHLDSLGRPAKPGDPEELVSVDVTMQNDCWEKLGKTRPDVVTCDHDGNDPHPHDENNSE